MVIAQVMKLNKINDQIMQGQPNLIYTINFSYISG